ncbi:MAG: hypothetical protein HZA62_14045 [Rhodocyclales bacterium]|nr:hypothetical protein [Rhodocyclales bacterium]
MPWLAIVPLLVGLCACAPPRKNAATPAAAEPAVLWPAPPDLPRFEYETILQSAADISIVSKDERWARAIRGLAGEVSDAPVISRPTAIASRRGRIYVAEPSVKAITVFDIQRSKIFRFGQREPNLLKRPQALAIDDHDRVHVLDTQLRKVMVFDDMGLYLHGINLGNKLANPVGLAVSGDGGTVYVVDRGNVESDDHKVVALARDGTERFVLGPRGNGPGQFNIPLAAATARDGTIYVADSGNFRIQAFGPTGDFKFQFGGLGTSIGNFSRPRAISLDAEGNVYVGDGGFNNVQIFNSAGELLMPLGRLSRDPGPGNFALLAGIAVDETRRLYVLDHFHRKIEVYRRLDEEEAQRKAAAKRGKR